MKYKSTWKKEKSPPNLELDFLTIPIRCWILHTEQLNNWRAQSKISKVFLLLGKHNQKFNHKKIRCMWLLLNLFLWFFRTVISANWSQQACYWSSILISTTVIRQKTKRIAADYKQTASGYKWRNSNNLWIHLHIYSSEKILSSEYATPYNLKEA